MNRGVALLTFLLLATIQVHAADSRPNIIVIVVDDMRFDEFGAGGHPYVETPNVDRLAAEGAMFTNAYHVTPLCSPNRASLLTGQYVSRHGVLDNTSRSVASHRLDLYPKTLQRAGYMTAHVGKWHMGNDPAPRPGFDYWVSFSGQGKLVDPGCRTFCVWVESSIGHRESFAEVYRIVLGPDAKRLANSSLSNENVPHETIFRH